MAFYTIVHCNVISYFVYYGGPLMAICSVMATVVNGRQAIIVIYKEAVEIN
jgi:hypothetical protein